ncbi:aromatic amino acid lyase [Parapedobacter sp. ISTM3]|uniref:Histidine ammonia-lyase n=1 Tax=Parapedobacter luteus TaxID=623280 RepID=A0A1T5DUL7_9SPHI|nr:MULTISPECIES: aromatic amino acid ammonia-lyase [Parapedobacter]MBK1440790.1 aromatic amino acid lyase [Parapedobacter sp. ISTM3]SKB75385.1 histidine ammonia-lyase [Parapedobacter luteus]
MTELTNPIALADFYAVLFENQKINLPQSTSDRINESHHFLKNFAKDKIIYGVNTGFGPMAQYRIAEADQIQLQYNLIRSHATGMGDILEPRYAKSVLLARLHTLSLGYSGVHLNAVALMKEMLNRDILPVIYQHGGVGASGDLVQLAHLALNMIGEGNVYYRGNETPAAQALASEGLEPMQIHIREGLALINGTSVMTGIGIVNAIYAKRLLHWSIMCSAWINELVRAYDDHLSETLNGTKKHPGQRQVAALMRDVISDSKLVRKRHEHLYNRRVEESIFKDKLQEYYSIRCVPQILGPIWDALQHCTTTLIEEVNSANDNPIVDIASENVFHGGNFHGDYIAFEMDKLRIAIAKLTMLMERQLNYLLNASLNEILPSFVNLGKLGLNFGMQGAQFTATSTTAENQTLATPIYTHSIPNNKDNQDIVSMGTNAAWLTKKVIDNAYEVLAIQLVTLVQAVDALECRDKLSTKSGKVYVEIRSIVPTFKEDITLSPYLARIKDYIKAHDAIH